MVTISKWQREIGRVVAPGAERLAVKAVARMSDNGITVLTREKYLLIQDMTGMPPSEVRRTLRLLQDDGWLRIWTPDKPSSRDCDELIVQLI